MDIIVKSYFPDLVFSSLVLRLPFAARRPARPRGDPHCYGCKITSSEPIRLIVDANSSATTFSEPMVAFRRPLEAMRKNARWWSELSQNRGVWGSTYLELTIII